MRTNLHNIKGSKVLVVGLGKSGTATCQMLVDMGAHVSVQDNRKETDFDRNFIEYLRGRGVDFYFDTLPSELGDYDMMVLSPGVSSELFFVEEAKEKGEACHKRKHETVEEKNRSDPHAPAAPGQSPP